MMPAKAARHAVNPKALSAPVCAVILAALSFLLPSPAWAVKPVPPSSTNQGNWNREEMIDYMERCWTEENLAGLADWFNSSKVWEAIWVKNLYWQHEDSPFKRKLTVMMLKGSPDAWGDPDPDGLPPVNPMRPEERSATLIGCIEEIHLAAPDMKVSEADLQNNAGRSQIAEKFAAATGLSAMVEAPAELDEDAPSVDPAGKATKKEQAPHRFGRSIVLALAGVLAAGAFVIFQRKKKTV